AGFGYASPVVAGGKVYLVDSKLDRPHGQERVTCLQESNGRLLWTHAYDVVFPDWAFTPGQEAGPNATPIVDAGRVYALGWHGDLHCMDAASGEVVWKKDLAKEYPVDELRTT